MTMTLPHVAQPQATHWPPRGPARVLVVLDRPVRVELVRMTLSLGVFSTRAVVATDEVEAIVADWQPHLIILDMDLDGTRNMSLLSAKSPSNARLPVIGLTRRGDLRNKLGAFEAGVDDILTVPFAARRAARPSHRPPAPVLQRRGHVHARHQDR
jgi:DNA-binding response OmpR family regulator